MENFTDHILDRIIKKDDGYAIKLCEEVTKCELCLNFLGENRRQVVLDWFIKNNSYRKIDTIQLSFDLPFKKGQFIYEFDNFYQIISGVLNKLLKNKITSYQNKSFLVLFDLSYDPQKTMYVCDIQIMIPISDKPVRINRKRLNGDSYFKNIIQLDLEVFNQLDLYLKIIDKNILEGYFNEVDNQFGIKTEIMKYIFLWGVFQMRIDNGKINCDNWELNKNHLGYESN